MLDPSANHPIALCRRGCRWVCAHRKILVLLLGIAVAAVLVSLTALFLIHRHVYRFGENEIYDVTNAPACRVGIIFGAGFASDGGPSLIMVERLKAGLALYQSGRVKKLIVSGNNQFKHNRESDCMLAWMIAHGVAEGDVQADHAGFRTLDTCIRAAKVWGLTEPVLMVSQAYHLPRILFLANAAGLKAYGVFSTDKGVRDFDHNRERIARILAWFDVYIFHRGPKYLGPRETI